MNIAVLAHSLFPIGEPFQGGLEKITHELCTKLMTRGHKITLFAHPDSDRSLNVVPLEKPDLPEKHFRADDGSTFLNYEMFAQNSIYANTIAKLSKYDFDVIHNQSLSETAMILCNFLDVPAVTTFHTPPFENLKLGTLTIKENLNQQIICVSESLANTWRSLLDPIDVIYNGIDLNKWNCSYDTPENSAFWYGRICPEKAPHDAIKACIEANVPLVLAGPISNRDYYTEFMAPYLDHHLINYCGHLDRQAINEILKKSRLCLFTSVWDEPYGLVLAESLACGTPVVAYNSGAASEILTATTGILVKTGDWKAISNVLVNQRNFNRKACRKRAEIFCNIDDMVSRYEKLYQKICCEKERKLAYL